MEAATPRDLGSPRPADNCAVVVAWSTCSATPETALLQGFTPLLESHSFPHQGPISVLGLASVRP